MKKRLTKKKNTFFGDVEHEWLATHPSEVAKYAGQYIAVVGRKIVAHGYDFEAVFHKAKKIGDNPLFDKVPDTEVVAYGTI
jgi:hypothetical protein